MTPRTALALVAALSSLAACSSDQPSARTPQPTASAPSSTGSSPGGTPGGAATLRLETVVDDLDTVWSLAFDSRGTLWWTERGGRLGRVGGADQQVAGVRERGEAGLMGLAFDAQDRAHLMYTGDVDNRVVRLDGQSQTVLVDGIPKGGIHDGGRLRFGPDDTLYIGTGDAGEPDSAQDPESFAGKVLRLDPGAERAVVHSRGHRNVQGLCFAPDGRLFKTEHGPDRGDEIGVVERGGDGGWPDDVGDGLRSYTPTIAPAGCAFYDAATIPQWRGSLLFVTLKERDLRRLSFTADGAVSGRGDPLRRRARPAPRRRGRPGWLRLPRHQQPRRPRRRSSGPDRADQAGVIVATHSTWCVIGEQVERAQAVQPVAGPRERAQVAGESPGSQAT